jgi:protein ImuB
MKVVCLWFPKEIAIEKLAENCLRLSPQICFRGKEALFIEYGKCLKIYSEEGFFSRLQVILRRLGLSAQIAKGQDIPDSFVLAKYQKSNLDSLPLDALVDLADPLNRDPVAQKYISKMVLNFSDLGIRTLKEFRKIPSQELVSRFGPVAALCQQRLKSESTVPWPVWKPEEKIFEKFQFPYFEFYGELEPILFELKKQLDHIFQRLWARSLKAQSLEVRIYTETNSFNPRSFKNFHFDFLLPQGQTKGALNIIKERLSKEFEKNPICTPIEGLETRVHSTVPGAMAQKNFFHNREEVAEQFYSLLGQLAEAHGAENVFHAQLMEDRRPEKSWRKTSKPALSQVNLEGRIPLRPTYLLKPQKIDVTAGFIHIHKKAFKIVKWSQCVERITGGWIEMESAMKNQYDRNYYQAEIESGVVLSVFQTPDQGYYLHGYFG